MSTYDPYEAIKKIFGYKQDWTNYNQSGETEKRNKAAQEAQVYYNQLKENGYGELADELSGAGLQEAEKITNTYGKTGKTAVRKYLKTIGKQYGFTDEDIDKNLSYDNDTGEITFGGMNMGKPYAVVNGVSYMPEEEINNFMKNYVENTGTTLTPDVQIAKGNQWAFDENAELMKMQNSDHELMNNLALENIDYAKNHNPYESDIGKSIMGGFRVQGDRSAGNAIAESASTNSGNLDSFAAAEGARQRAAFEQLGTQAVLEDFNTRMGHLNDIFNNLGIYHQNQYASMGDTISRGAAIAQQVFDQGFSDRQLESAERMATGQNETSLALADKEAKNNIDTINAETQGRKEIIQESAKYSTRDDKSYTYQNGVKVGDENGKPILTKEQATEMNDSGNNSEQVKYALDYYGENGGTNSNDDAWAVFLQYFPEGSEVDDNASKLRNFLNEQLKPYYDSGRRIDEEVIENLIVGNNAKNSNSTKYDIDTIEAKAICNALGLDPSWVDKYKDRWGFNSGKGMKSAE